MGRCRQNPDLDRSLTESHTHTFFSFLFHFFRLLLFFLLNIGATLANIPLPPLPSLPNWPLTHLPSCCLCCGLDWACVRRQGPEVGRGDAAREARRHLLDSGQHVCRNGVCTFCRRYVCSLSLLKKGHHPSFVAPPNRMKRSRLQFYSVEEPRCMLPLLVAMMRCDSRHPLA